MKNRSIVDIATKRERSERSNHHRFIACGNGNSSAISMMNPIRTATQSAKGWTGQLRQTRRPFRTILSRSALVAAMLWICGVPFAASIQAQGLPQVVTLNSGVQFEGEVFSVGAVPAGERNPYGAKPIAVVDDGLRLIHFSLRPGERIISIADSQRRETTFDIWQKAVNQSVTDGFGALLYVGPFNQYGHRLLRYRDGDGTWDTVQGITQVNPRWCEVRSLVEPGAKRSRNWTMRVSTRTINPDVLREFLRQQIVDPENPTDYEAIVDFLLQAEMFSRAMDELTLIQARFPDIRQRVEQNRRVVRQAYARQYLREVRARIDAGQPSTAKTMLEVFDRTGVAGEIVAEIDDLAKQLNGVPDRLADVSRAINDLLDRTLQSTQGLDEDQKNVIEQFRTDVQSNLNESNQPRLDAVLRLIDDATLTDAQKTALAISGWVMGSNNAEDNLAVVTSLYPVRRLIREYLSTADAVRRGQIIRELAAYETGAPEYVAKIVGQMRPPRSDEDVQKYDGNAPLEFTVSVAGSRKNPEPLEHRVQVHLPPEYDPWRKYPCIITLPEGNDLDQQMARWCGTYNEKLGTRVGQAMRYGYIVVAVDWKLPNQGQYGYTKREHAAVLKAYREALRRYAIDSDRVFLTGHGPGADAAYDIALSHPEHWAGVAGFSGKIDRYADLYAENQHVRLPIYMVVGSKDLVSKDASKDALNRWLSSRRYLETIYVEYKGRVNEPLVEEIVEVFKWMQAQRRKWPDRTGFSLEFKIRRPWDNYFWFYEFHGLPEENTTWPELWERRHPRALTLTAELKDNQPNRFIVGPSNTGSGVTLWLSPEFVDFDREIVVTGRGRGVKKFVEPSTAIILEDVRRRADRQHPFWAKLECRGTAWEE